MNRPLSRKHLLRLPLAITLAAGLAAASLSGCGEEPPPPPPPKKDPPPPPPPPPPELSIQALLQEMKADARVTFADNVKLTDEALARSVISLADGFARGDASKLRSLLEAGGQGVLGSLDASGEWASSTSGIEAVRIVYVGDPGDALPGGETAAGMADMGTITANIVNAFKDIPPDQLALAQPTLDAFKTELMTPDHKLDWDKFKKDLEAAGVDAATAVKIRAALQSAVSGATIEAIEKEFGDVEGEVPPPRPHFSHVVVMAIQDPKGAFLLGWGVPDGGSGKFAAAATAAVTKPRASDFDSVGLNAFSTGAAATEQPGVADPAKKHDEAEPAPTPGEEPAPGGPKRKSTPGGPVTIPGSG